jgi:hypothetical protein
MHGPVPTSLPISNPKPDGKATTPPRQQAAEFRILRAVSDGLSTAGIITLDPTQRGLDARRRAP